MKRYNLHWGGQEGVAAFERDDGEWVRYEDAESEMDRMHGVISSLVDNAIHKPHVIIASPNDSMGEYEIANGNCASVEIRPGESVVVDGYNITNYSDKWAHIGVVPSGKDTSDMDKKPTLGSRELALWRYIKDTVNNLRNPAHSAVVAEIDAYFVGDSGSAPPDRKKPTFREYVISRHGSYPPSYLSPVATTLQLAERLAEWVEI